MVSNSLMLIMGPLVSVIYANRILQIWGRVQGTCNFPESDKVQVTSELVFPIYPKLLRV